MCNNTANNINLHYRTNSVKINLNSIFFKIYLNATPYFWSILGLTSTTAVDWHLSQRCRVRCWSNEKLLHHSQHVKNLNSYIYTSDRAEITEISEITFSFPEFAPACKEISSFHPFTLEVEPISESHDQTCNTHF